MHILMYVLCVLYNLLFRPTNAQYINNKACIVKYTYKFQCIYIIFREPFLIYAKVTRSIKIISYNVGIGGCYRYSIDYKF